MGLVSMLSIFLISCSQKGDTADGGQGGKKIKVGVSIANFDDTFLTYMMDGMKKAAEKEGDIELEFVDAKEDIAKQMNQVENFVTQGTDVDTSVADPMTNAAVTNGTKIVYVNRNPGNLPDGAYYVGSEEKKAGIMQMEYLAEKMGGKGNIVILMGKLDNEGTIKRTEGVEEIAKKYPDIKILDKQTGLWQRTDGMAKTENWLNKYGNEINAIVSNNDDMALGAVQALKDSGKTGIFVIGVDATPDGLAALAAGDISATVFQDADGQGGGAVEVAKKAANGETVVKETWVPFKLVTPENINEFKK
jgi:inositol transport system substrate-binding protein